MFFQGKGGSKHAHYSAFRLPKVRGNNLLVLVGRQYISINFSPFEHVALIAIADLKRRSVSAAVIFQFRVNIKSSIKTINQWSRNEVLIMEMNAEHLCRMTI